MPDVFRELDNIHADMREIRRDYVPERLFVELVTRVGRIEERLDNFINDQNTDDRSWLRGLGLAAAGVIFGVIAQMIRSGGGH